MQRAAQSTIIKAGDFINLIPIGWPSADAAGRILARSRPGCISGLELLGRLPARLSTAATAFFVFQLIWPLDYPWEQGVHINTITPPREGEVMKSYFARMLALRGYGSGIIPATFLHKAPARFTSTRISRTITLLPLNSC
jgi:hypothetical protein